MWSSNHFSISSCFPCFSESRFFRVQVFQGPGFSRCGSRVRVQVQDPWSGSRVRVQLLEVAIPPAYYRLSRIQIKGNKPGNVCENFSLQQMLEKFNFNDSFFTHAIHFSGEPCFSSNLILLRNNFQRTYLMAIMV